MMVTEPQARDVVLVVDDSPETLGMVTDALEDIGATVLVALGGEKALSLVDKVTPDVILMDCLMPGMDGFEACRRLKADPALQHVPVIFMTGLSETDNIVNGFKAGGVDYLTKPIVPEELIARMRVHIANARQTQTAQTLLDKARRHLVAVDGGGRILWSTAQATALLAHCSHDFATRSDLLPDRLVAWLGDCRRGTTAAALEIDLAGAGDGRLMASYLGQAGSDEFLIRVVELNEGKDKEVLKHTFDLTLREAEVLLWVAQGKSNKDIADILDISPRTINKHLEPIFTKLGVENRTSAATMAMRTLWGG